MDSKRMLMLEAGQRGLQLARALGRKEQYLDIATEYDPEVGPLDNLYVDPRIRSFELDPDERKGAVLIPIIQSRTKEYRCGVFAHAFQTRGYEPLILRCDADLNFCFRKERDSYNDLRCASCKHQGNEILQKFGLDKINIGELVDGDQGVKITGANLEDTSEYRGINVEKYALSSARAFLRKYHVDLSNEHERSVYRGFLQTAITITDATYELFDQYDICAVLGADQAYVYDGIPMAVGAEHDVPAAGEGPGRIPNKHAFGYQTNRSSLLWFTDENILQNIIEEQLSKEDQSRINEIMSQRVTGENIRYYHVSGADQSIDPQSGRTAGLFTNLMWDASLSAEGGLYDDPYEWVIDTIDYVSELDELTLVIKTHPAEKLRGTNEPMGEWIKDHYAPLPDNVVLLKPDTDVSPYALMDDLDFGIVFNSTVGMEMAYEGVPVVVTGETHYRNLGMTYDPETVQEYFSLIGDLNRKDMGEDMLRRAQRYAHFFFVKKHIDFKYNKPLEDGTVMVDHDDIKPGNANFDLIVEKILNGEPVVE